jgi:hypothetical protein
MRWNLGVTDCSALLKGFPVPDEVPGVLIFATMQPHHQPKLILPTMIEDKHSQLLPINFSQNFLLA